MDCNILTIGAQQIIMYNKSGHAVLALTVICQSFPCHFPQLFPSVISHY